jgi:hypothetical protein
MIISKGTEKFVNIGRHFCIYAGNWSFYEHPKCKRSRDIQQVSRSHKRFPIRILQFYILFTVLSSSRYRANILKVGTHVY